MNSFSFLKILVPAFPLLLVLSCERMDYKHAREEDTVEAYSTFLEKHPDGEYAQKARLNIESLVYKKARQEDEIQSYQEYLDMYEKPAWKNEALERIMEIKLAGLKDSDSIRAHEIFISEYSSSREAEKVRRRLLKLLAGKYKDAQGEEKERLRKKIMAKTKNVLIEVDKKTYLSPFSSYGYKQDIESDFSNNGFSIVRQKAEADLYVKLKVREWQSGEYENSETGKIVGEGTEISGHIAIHNLHLGEDLFASSMSMDLPFMVFTNIYDECSTQFREHVFYKNAAELTCALAGRPECCPPLFESLAHNLAYDDDQQVKRARYLIRKTGCRPADERERASLAVADGDRKACLEAGKECVDIICMNDYLSQEHLAWLTDMGAQGVSCLCRQMNRSIAFGDTYTAREIKQVLFDMKNEKAYQCLENTAAGKESPDTYEDFYMEFGSKEEEEEQKRDAEIFRRELREELDRKLKPR